MTYEWWVTAESGAKLKGPYPSAIEASLARTAIEEEAQSAEWNLWVRRFEVTR